MLQSRLAKFSAADEDLLFRSVVVVGVIATAVLLKPFDGFPDRTILLALSLVFAYLLTTFIIQRLSKDTGNLALALKSLGQVDALLLGGFVVYIEFDAFSSAVFFGLLQYRALTNGGMARWRRDNLAFIAGLLVCYALLRPSLEISYTPYASTLALLMVAAYLCIFGYVSFLKNAGLRRMIAQMEQEQIRLKMLNYQFSKYLSPNLKEKIEQDREVKLSTQRKRLVVFFSDIVGFSEIADRMDEAALTVLINNYLTEMSKIALEYGGTIDKFVGDAVMVFFGDPTTKGPKEDCLACVSMAFAMRKRAIELAMHWKNEGLLETIQIRMGISTGFCTVGNFGTETRLDYTLLGSEVNLASRLETSAKPGEILISQSTHEMIKDVIYTEDRGSVVVKGFKSPIKAYAAVDFRKNLNKKQDFLNFSTNGFSLVLDGEKVANYDRTRVLTALRSAIQFLNKNTPS
ncbi:MAG TPA: hypothetical protein DIT58_04095 [Porticoccaceae bacterium]|nr:hypothetical protein [Porticoccaceae bacterium]